ncbi:MAG TPA: TIGR01777 family oxidoreductase [Candidatus Acidoferrum sp.]|nr:TIGR01777 family oxidoreductase [Candidatus Acidoferrum sp.]
MTRTTTRTDVVPQLPPSCLGTSLRIVIPGGEGYLGRVLGSWFTAAGHSVITLTRRQEVVQDGRGLWAKVWWDGKDSSEWVNALENANVVINLSGRSVDCRYNAKNRDEIFRSRIESTAILGKAIQSLRCPPSLWLNASTATIYRHSYDCDMDEHNGEFGGNESDAPHAWRFSIDVARMWEETFFASQTPSVRKISMRAAMVMGAKKGGVFPVVLRLARMGLGGPWGDGRQYMSWIHELDFCRAVEFLIRGTHISGAVNLAASHPIPNQDFMREVREAQGSRFGLPAKAWMLSVGTFLLRTESELLLKSRRVVPGVLLKHGFEFRFAKWREAAEELAQRCGKSSSAISHVFFHNSSEGNDE